MSLTTVAILIAILDLGVIAAVAAIMCVPLVLDRSSEPAPVETLAPELPLDLAA